MPSRDFRTKELVISKYLFVCIRTFFCITRDTLCGIFEFDGKRKIDSLLKLVHKVYCFTWWRQNWTRNIENMIFTFLWTVFKISHFFSYFCRWNMRHVPGSTFSRVKKTNLSSSWWKKFAIFYFILCAKLYVSCHSYKM